MTSLFADDFTPAIFSPCRTWRYRLERRWSAGTRAAFILLNPSTADETKDDPTIRRCIAYAKAWGCGGLILGNIFALRSTDPRALYTADEPVGLENDAHLARITSECRTIVCGWGTHGALHGRGAAVLELMRGRGVTPLALHVTGAGHPGHPLYLPKTATLIEI